MPFRRLIRGNLDDDTLADIASDVAGRYGEEMESVERLEADNWLSTPCVVNDQWFVKVVSEQNSLVHALLTTGRNLGVFSSGREGFFEHFGTPVDMAEHELAATERMRELGVNAPEPLEAFEHGDHGIVVLEYLPDYVPLDDLEPDRVEDFLPALLDSLAAMHDDGLVHGDLRSENVLIVDDDLYFIDATKVREAAIEDARAYDIACAMAALEPLVGANSAVSAAVESYSPEILLDADTYLDFVNIRPDHDFDAASVKGQISKAAE
jgi:tRNA A-37 threonylcarbamoyl transferase component Bud32